MNTKTVLSTILGLSVAVSAWSQASITQTFHTIVNQAILDNDPSGLASSITPVFNSALTEVTRVRVFLNVSGDFNGDLYAYLRHGTDFTVLLNRVGRTTGNPYGYGDPGLDIILADSAANGDIHVYQNALVPPNTPLTTALTGVWQPDGRNVGPTTVLETTPRTAMLSVFNNKAPTGGPWTLFIADLSGGGANTLISWDLEVTGVPEPSALALIGLGLAALVIRRRKQ